MRRLKKFFSSQQQQQQQRQSFPTTVAGARQRRWRRGGPAEVEGEEPIHVGASSSIDSKPLPPLSAGAIALCVLQHSHAAVADSLFVRLLNRACSLNDFSTMPMSIHTSHVGGGGRGIAESEEQKGTARKEEGLNSRVPLSSSSTTPSSSPLWSTLLASSARLLADCADRTSGMHAHMQFDEEGVGPHGVPPVDVVVGDGSERGGGFVPQAVAVALLIVLFCTAAFSVATAVIGGLRVFFCVRPLPRAASSLSSSHPRAAASVSQSSSIRHHCSPFSPRHHTNGSGKPFGDHGDAAASSPPRQMLRITNYGPSPSSYTAPSSSRHSRSFLSSVAYASSTLPPLNASSAPELPSPPRLFSSSADRSVRYSALLASRLALLGCFSVALVLFCRDDLFSSSSSPFPPSWKGGNGSVQATTMGVGGVGDNSSWRGGESSAACGSSPPFAAVPAALGAQQQQLLELFVLMAFALFAAIADPHNSSSRSSSSSAASARRSTRGDGRTCGLGAWAGRPSRRPLPPVISSHTDSHSAQNPQLLPPLLPPSRMRGIRGSEGAFAGRNSVSSDSGLSLPLAFSSFSNASPRRGFSSSSVCDPPPASNARNGPSPPSTFCFVMLPLPSPPWCPSSTALSISSVVVVFLLGGASTRGPSCAWAGQDEGDQGGGGNNSAAAFPVGASAVGATPSHLFVLLWAPLAWQALCYYSRSAARAHWRGAFFGH